MSATGGKCVLFHAGHAAGRGQAPRGTPFFTSPDQPSSEPVPFSLGLSGFAGAVGVAGDGLRAGGLEGGPGDPAAVRFAEPAE
jgi:hypothetical protein